MDTLQEDIGTFIVISRLILVRISNVSDKLCIENRIHVLCPVALLRKSCHFMR